MIYLFNSAFRGFYQENLLATLFLPHGWDNDYRYTISSQRRNVSEEFTGQVSGLKGTKEVIISFIDRYGKDEDGNDAYRYYPVRKAALLKCHEDTDKLYIKVKLLDFIYPKDLSLFNKLLLKNLIPLKLAKLTNNDTEEVNDGHYAIQVDNIIEAEDEYVYQDDAWSKCVNAISKTKPFESSDEKQFVFAKGQLLEYDGDNRLVESHLSNNHWYKRALNNGAAFYKTRRGEKYYFKVNYVYPIQEKNTDTKASMICKPSDNIAPLGSTLLPINSSANRISFGFSLKETAQDKDCNINFSFVSDQDSSEIIAPNRSIGFRIGNSKSHWLLLIVATLIFLVSAIVIGLDIKEGEDFNLWNYIKSDWYKFLAPIGQAFALYLFFKLTGKKS
jgi:hypothetical protein